MTEWLLVISFAWNAVLTYVLLKVAQRVYIIDINYIPALNTVLDLMKQRIDLHGTALQNFGECLKAFAGLKPRD